MQLFVNQGLALDPAPDAQTDPVRAAAAADAAYRAQVADAAERFEGFFITQMLRQMRRVTSAMADDDSALNNRVNQDMLDLADGVFADSLAGQRAFGIADAIVRQLLPPSSARPGAAQARDQDGV